MNGEAACIMCDFETSPRWEYVSSDINPYDVTSICPDCIKSRIKRLKSKIRKEEKILKNMKSRLFFLEASE